MTIPLFDLREEYKLLKTELNLTFNNICKSAEYIKGPWLESFETDFAQFVGTNYSVGVASGTDALYLSLHALGITAGDEVLVPVNTFVATAYAILYVGAKPVFVDIDENTFNINPNLLEEKITKKTKAIIPVHLYGNPVDMDQIKSIAKKYNLFVIEDAAQAHGAMYKNQQVGNLSDIAAFSFYPNKNLGAYGDGGAITTNSKTLTEKLKKIREYGASEKYIFDEVGFNSRLDSIQAAILSIKLRYLEKMTKLKQQKADNYTQFLNKFVPIIKTPEITENATHSYHLYTIRSEKRDELLKFLAEKGIQTGIYYPLPLHLQKALRHLRYKKGDFPIAEKVSNEILALPLYPHITKTQQQHVLQEIKHFFA